MTMLEPDPTTIRFQSRPTSAAEILDRARTVAPLIRERAEETERIGQLPQDVFEMVRDTGVFGMAVKKSWGGPELDAMQQTEVIEAIATGDASAAWVAMIGMDTPIYNSYLDETVAKELFTDPDAVTAGAIMPQGRGERVPGGFRVSGQWFFGSGISHATWVIGGFLVTNDGELEANPRTGKPGYWRIYFAPVEQLDVQETWDTTGLRGSGSKDYRVTDMFVPEEHTFSFAEPRVTGPTATPDTILRNMAGVPLGVARAAIDHVRAMAATKVDKNTNQPWAENYRIQTVIAQAEMDLIAARYGVYGSLERQWQLLEAGVESTPELQVESVLARVNAFRTARSIVARLFDLVATAAVYKPSPMDRWLRDLNTMCQHVIAQDVVVQSAGAVLLGGTPHMPYSVGIVD
ncbi:acyl-CoA dehydrogenase family protein [Kitasatospora sp. NPDC002227]|uniref:acyl-CoA dehydrogenase family protein n=1 Tax=Kitasatospora sp. NPDC002227 TaxID=3154773 RepID=UPI00332AE732